MQRCIIELKQIGIEVNPKKTEIINVGLADENVSRVVDSFNILLKELKTIELTNIKLHKSPILKDTTRGCIMKKLTKYKRMSDHILLLDRHPGHLLMKNAFYFPRLMDTLRTAPCHYRPELLIEYDKVMPLTTEVLCNVCFDDNCWLQT